MGSEVMAANKLNRPVTDKHGDISRYDKGKYKVFRVSMLNNAMPKMCHAGHLYIQMGHSGNEAQALRYGQASKNDDILNE